MGLRRRLIFLGPPGSGKGTQAAVLARKLGVPALSSGDLLRQEAAQGSDLGRKVAGIMAAGQLVPDDLITGIMLSGLARTPEGFILDGFPRTVPQAEALDAGLPSGAGLDLVIDFHAPDEVIITRIDGRRVCQNCKATYNLDHLPPRKPGVCDACGGPLVQRSDDRRDVVQTRLAAYRAQTAPLVEYYGARGLLREVNAAADPPAVEHAVWKLVEGHSGT